MVSYPALRPDQVATLQGALNTGNEIVGTVYDPECRYRGCSEDGLYFMRRELKNGSIQEGLFCDEHDEKFGEQNLRRWAHSLGTRVEILEDREGAFRGVNYDTMCECIREWEAS